MKRGFDRRGISPVVASALMIFLVLVLAILVFLWARGFIGEQVNKFGSPIEEACGKISFDVSKINSHGGVLEVINSGNIDIKEFELKKFDGKGNSELERFSVSVDALGSASNYADLEMEDGSDPDEVIIYPVLVGTSGSGNSLFTCMESGVTL